MESVCPGCVHDKGLGLGSEMVNFLKYDLSNPDDCDEIDRSPHAAAIRYALGQPRPKRCELLQKILPPVVVTDKSMPYAACPEIGVANQFADDETFAKTNF